MTLRTQRVQTVEQVRCVATDEEAVEFEVLGRASAYDFIRRTLVRFDYVDQGVPLAAVSSEPGSLQRQDHSHLAAADRGQRPVVARALSSATGLTEIVIDHHNLAPAQFSSTAFEPVLPASALAIVSDLVGSGLPDIDPGLA